MLCANNSNRCNTCLNQEGIIHVDALEFFELSKDPDPISTLEKRATQCNSTKILIGFASHTITPTPNTLIYFAAMMPVDFFIAICYPCADPSKVALSDDLNQNRVNPIRIFNTCIEAIQWLAEQEYTKISKYS